MKTLIIDDSELDRLNLKSLLEDHPQLEVVGEAPDLSTGRELLAQHSPDLLFLDIHLGKEKGFQLLDDAVDEPLIILTTAHPQYALKGFQIDALDYILKPVTEENLARAVSRLPKGNDGQLSSAIQLATSLFFKSQNGFRRYRIGDIALISTDRPYTHVRMMDGESYLDRRTMRQWRDSLPEADFLALDRSCLVRLEAIERVSFEDEAHLHFTSEALDPMTLGPSALKKLRELLKL
jgi:two-component system, LytTR family, response regulator